MNVTKKALSQALKELMNVYSFEKITILEITQEAGLSRNTFYYHFSDINELLEWTYDNEIVSGLETYEDLGSWKEGLLNVLNYTEENRKFCLNTFHSVNRERLEWFLYEICYGMLLSIVEREFPERIEKEEIKKQIADFYGRAIVAQVIHWLTTRLEEPKDQFITRVERVTKGTIELIIQNH